MRALFPLLAVVRVWVVLLGIVCNPVKLCTYARYLVHDNIALRIILYWVEFFDAFSQFIVEPQPLIEILNVAIIHTYRSETASIAPCFDFPIDSTLVYLVMPFALV